MWYFTIKQHDLKNEHNRRLQKMATHTETELFSEPYENYTIVEVESVQYAELMNYLDLEGITYEVATTRPRREDLLERMK